MKMSLLLKNPTYISSLYTLILLLSNFMHMSDILPVVADKKPENLSIVCLDNGTWGSTGDQPTPSYVDMELRAISAGIENTRKVHTEEELRSALERLYDEAGPRFLHVVVKPGNVEVEDIKLKAEQIKRRFTKAVISDLIV
ncbi:MAG: thiamine pyrophosphate-dependent enzyme [archaeon]|nr:thiamine pyrophosphate-dependent enzyme [archaeon]